MKAALALLAVLPLVAFAKGKDDTVVPSNPDTLRRGSKGPLVKAAQRALDLEQTGVYDIPMERAVREYSRQLGLDADGAIGFKAVDGAIGLKVAALLGIKLQGGGKPLSLRALATKKYRALLGKAPNADELADLVRLGRERHAQLLSTDQIAYAMEIAIRAGPAFQRKNGLRKPPVIVIPSPNFGARLQGERIDTIVLHHTAMATAEGAMDILRDPREAVSSHYLLSRDGTLFQLVSDERRAWHAGTPSALHGEECDVNSRSIGIEIDNEGDGDALFTEVQYTVLEQLVPWLARTYDVSPKNLVGHKDVALPVGRKDDPAPNFDFERIRRSMSPGPVATGKP
jgi:N-acetyl-anhydromuramyl-L-alanine amidase AmpD